MERVYIAGCGGMLGHAFYEEFAARADLRCTDIDVNEDWLDYLDFTDFERYRQDVRDHASDCLFHLGALTDLEYCEGHNDEAYAANTLAVENAVFKTLKEQIIHGRVHFERTSHSWASARTRGPALLSPHECGHATWSWSWS